MIGWKCNVGVITKYPPQTLSDCNFLDFEAPIVFPELSYNSTEQINGDIDTLYSALTQWLGEDVFKYYAFPRRTVNVDASIIQYLPSYNLAYPNTWEFVKNNSNQYPILYIPSLGTGFYRAASGTTAFRIDNNSFVTTASYFPNTVIGDEFQFAVLVNYKQGDNLGEENKVCLIDGRLLINSNGYVRRIYPAPSFPGFPDGFGAVFGASKPDIIVNPNPYEPGGPSGPTDPTIPPGTFDNESDPIPDSPLPTLSAANTGFTRIYNPTLSQVQALARYLWTDESVIETIWNHVKQFFENPMEAIIGFNLVPVPVPDGGTENFALMYIDTGVSMTVAANQFVDLDCGTVELKRYYGSALDQSPYTKVSCFLPYIGTVNLNTDEVMGTTLQVKYRVDIVSGSCVAKIFVDGNCLYQYSGHCAITIPISSADFSSYVSAAISVGKLAAAAITAGAGAAMAAGVAEASQQTNQVVTTTQVTNTARNPSTGRQITTGTTTTVQTRESPADQSSTQASFSGLSPQNVANTVGAIMSSKPHIEHSGSFSGNSGYLGVRRPFLIIERPNMCMPANYQALNGFPAMFTMELSTCKGFTRVQQVQLTGMGRATNPEQAEILELLKSGVVL